MAHITLGAPGLADVRWPHYVNGRLLTAQDLAATQAAVLARESWLGSMVGAGVAHGFEVTGSSGTTVLQVSPGTGVCLGGTAVHLENVAALDLAVVTSTVPPDGAAFAECTPTFTSTKAPTAGAYLLTVRPASVFQGKVPVQGAPTSSVTTPCTSRWEAEAVVFSAVRLAKFVGPSAMSLRRNALAHWCFATQALHNAAADGFASPVNSPLTALDDIGPCDLPLAVFDWDGAALTFVDTWSARRRPTRPSAATAFTDVVSDHRTATGEARFLQFEDQLEYVLSTADRDKSASTLFGLLPPAGVVPIDPSQTAASLIGLIQKSVAAAAPAAPAAPVALPEEEAGRGIVLVDEDDDGAAGRLSPVLKKLRTLELQVRRLREELDQLRDSGGRAASAAGSARQRLVLTQTVVADLALASGSGVDVAAFFAGLPTRLGLVDAETVDFTIRRSWYDEPIPTDGSRGVDVFFVVSRETQSIAPYVLFRARVSGVRWLDPSVTWIDG